MTGLPRDRDIILEAINAYDDWMLDDDYDAGLVLTRIINRMRDRIIEQNLDAMADAVGLNEGAQMSEQSMTGALTVAYNSLKHLHRAGQKQGWHESNYPEEMEAARVALIAIDSSGLLSMRARTGRKELTVAYISSGELGHVKKGHMASIGSQTFERSIPVIIYPQED